MKLTVIIDKDGEEEITLRLKERTELSDKIEAMISETKNGFFGYSGGDAVWISWSEIYAVSVEDTKLYALTENEKYRLKMRLYEVEAVMGEAFVKINQSCIVRIDKILKFETSFSGALSVTLKNGYRDYVSRRQISAVKRSVGIK